MAYTFVLTGPQQFVHQGALIRAIRVNSGTVYLYDDHKSPTGTTCVATVSTDHPAVAGLAATLTRKVTP